MYVGEELVIDLVHDTTPGLPELGNKSEDNNNARAYDEDALQVVFSSSKVFTSVAMALMVEKGWLKYSDRVVDIWPEFGETQVCPMAQSAHFWQRLCWQLAMPEKNKVHWRKGSLICYP